MGTGTTSVETNSYQTTLAQNQGGAFTPPDRLAVVKIVEITETITEGVAAVVEIIRSGITTTPCSVGWRIANPAGKGGLLEPYTGVAGFDPGDLVIRLSLPSDPNIGLTDGSRNVQVILESPLGCVVDPSEGVATIVVTDQQSPTVSVSSVLGNTITEFDTGFQIVQFDIIKTGALIACSVNWTRDGTIADDDLETPQRSGTANFGASDTHVLIEYHVLGDRLVEPNETLTLTLRTATNCSIVQATATVTVIDDDTAANLPMPLGGMFYGLDRLADATVRVIYEYRKPIAVRFRAEHTGNLTAVRWNNRFDVTTGTDYSQGDGGTVRLEIRPYTENVLSPPNAPGTGAARFDVLPAGNTNLLGRTTDIVRAAETVTNWPTPAFQSPVAVVKDQLYWLVFNQLDATGNNWVSIGSDDLKAYVENRQIVHGGPYWRDSFLLLDSDGTVWAPSNGITAEVQGAQLPRLQFKYKLADNTEFWSGSATIFAFGSTLTPAGSQRKITTTSPVRMQFTPTRATFSCSKLWLRVYRETGDALPGNLSITLKRGTTVVGAWTAPPKIFPETVISNTDPAVSPYIFIDLGTPVSIQKDQQHYLELSPASGQYTIHAQQKSFTDFDSNNVFHDGCAEYLSGASWRGWGISDIDNRTDLVLPFLFDLTTSWWEALPRRSGRAWAAGPAYWYDRPLTPSGTDFALARFQAEEADTSLIDAFAASSKGEGGASIDTWDEVIGGPETGADDFTGTQFDWRASNWYGLGNALDYAATFSSGSALIFWVTVMIPANRATTATDVSIWDEIIAGTHDGKYIKFGQRFAAKVLTTSIPIERWIIDAHHEMNQSNIYRVWPEHRLKYKLAMERIINMVRTGAGYPVRFCHRPAYRPDPGQPKIGPYNTFVPANVDMLSLSIHPNSACNTGANIDKMFAGTLDATWYGTDELFAVANEMGLPVSFPEWSPKFEASDPCPLADTFMTKFYNNVLLPNKRRVVADCVFHQNVRDKNAYEGTTQAGKDQWSAFVDTRKTLYSGNKIGLIAPANSIRPSVSGSTIVGNILNCNQGSWTGTNPITYAYQWLRDGADITLNGNTNAYQTVAADGGRVISCRVTAQNTAGTLAVTSSNSITILIAPSNTARPVITGSNIVGNTLACNQGSWTPTPTTYAYQWLRAGVAIGTATASTYLTVTVDVGTAISCRVTAGNAVGTSTSTSLPVTITAVPAISPFVNRYPLRIESAAAGDITAPATFSPYAINKYTVAAGKVIDLRGRRGFNHDVTQGANIATFRFEGSNNSCITGGTTTCVNATYMAMPWAENHGHPQWDNPPGVRIDKAAGDVYVEGFHLHGTTDAIIPDEAISGSHRVHCNACYIVDCKDDGIQNDNSKNVSLRNCYIQGHAAISERPGDLPNGDRPPFVGEITEVNHCLFWQKRQRWCGDEKFHADGSPASGGGHAQSRKVGTWNSPTDQNNTEVNHQWDLHLGWGHKWFVKPDDYPGGPVGFFRTRFDMRNTLIRMDTIPVEGTDVVFPPIGDGIGAGSVRGSYYENVTILWMQGGTWPFPAVPAGVTIINNTDQCWSIWTKAEQDWFTVNGYDQASNSFDWTRFP